MKNPPTVIQVAASRYTYTEKEIRDIILEKTSPNVKKAWGFLETEISLKNVPIESFTRYSERGGGEYYFAVRLDDYSSFDLFICDFAEEDDEMVTNWDFKDGIFTAETTRVLDIRERPDGPHISFEEDMDSKKAEREFNAAADESLDALDDALAKRLKNR